MSEELDAHPSSLAPSPPPAADQEAAMAFAGKWLVMLSVGSGTYMTTLDIGIVNVVLPTLTRDFAASIITTQWVVLAYILCVTGLLLPVGRMADIFGRKEVYLIGFVLFALGSAFCGLAPGLSWLIAARAIQGVGGAIIQANGRALVTQAFPSSERGRALGILSSIVSLGLLSGPIVGGVIAAHLGWRWAFYVNVPICLIATPLGWRLLGRSVTDKTQRFDPLGSVLFMVAASALIIGLNQSGELGWRHPFVIGLLAAAIGLGLAFVLVERRVVQPTVDFSLFRMPAFSAAVGSGFLSFLATSPVTLLMPFYLTLVLRLRTDEAGFLLAATPALSMILAPVGGALSDRFGTRMIAPIGLAVETASLAGLNFLTIDGSRLLAVVCLGGVGIGIALFNSPNSVVMFDSVPHSRYGIVSGIWALTRNLGQSLGQTVAGVVWSEIVLVAAGSTVVAATDAPADAMMAGFRVAFIGAAILAASAMLLTIVAQPGRKPAAARAMG